jgi:hypothetical protein
MNFKDCDFNVTYFSCNPKDTLKDRLTCSDSFLFRHSIVIENFRTYVAWTKARMLLIEYKQNLVSSPFSLTFGILLVCVSVRVCVNVMCVCVCERERERDCFYKTLLSLNSFSLTHTHQHTRAHTHTHTHTLSLSL